MAFDIGSVVAHIKADLSNFEDGIKKAKQETASLKDKIEGVAGGIRSFAEKASLFSAAAAAGFGLLAKDVLGSGIAYDRLNKTLEVVAGNLNITTAEVDDMRKALRETNTQGSEATKVMLKFLQSGLQGQVDFKKYIGVVKDFAASVGVSSAKGIDNFTQAIVSLRPELLENYGIQFNLIDLYGRFADASGKKVAELTAEEKRMALLNEVYRQGATVQGVYAKTYDTAGKNILSIQDRLGELKDFIGIIFVPAFTRVTNLIQSTLSSWVKFFEDNQALIKSWSDRITAFVDTTGARIAEIFTTMTTALMPLGQWMVEHKDLVIAFFTGLAGAIGAILLVAPLLVVVLNPFILLFVSIGIAAGLLYAAWNSNFLGIQTSTLETIRNVTKWFNETLKPAIEIFTNWWADNWQSVALQFKGIWDIIVGIVQIAWAIVYGIISAGLEILSGDWKGAWQRIKEAVSMAWEGIKNIFNGIIEFLSGWGGRLIDKLTQPFREGLRQAEEVVRKIKDLLDFTKKHSPSVVDIVSRGVAQVNKALSGLEFSTSLTKEAAAVAVSNGGASTKINNVTVSLEGAMIGDEASATRLAEIVGDNIIRKLQMNVRF